MTNDNLRTFSIASRAYRTMLSDKCILNNLIKRKGVKHTKTQPKENENSVDNGIISIEQQRRRNKGTAYVSDRREEKTWKEDQKYPDTSNNYRRNHVSMDLRSRILRNSGGSLPKEIIPISCDDIKHSDRKSIESFTTPGRSIRKCCLTVFASCSKLSARCIGIIEGPEKRAYNCKPIGLSVRELSKSTSAGTDTLGKKNDITIQKRVIKQVRDIFKNPTSRKVIGLNPSYLYDGSMLERMFDLPELIFHRFQANYDKEKDVCTEKSRIVWCAPYTIVALENCFFGEIYESVKKKMLFSSDCIYPIGLTNYQIGQRSVKSLRDMFDLVGNSNNKIYSLDYKRFDASVPNWAKDLFFSTIRGTLDLNESEDHVYNLLRIYIKHTPFVYKDEILYKEKGISSGLFITNLFDTWWNLTIHYFVYIVTTFYEDKIDEISQENVFFDTLYLDPSIVKFDSVIDELPLRVLGDDTLILCDEHTLNMHKKVCLLLGMNVTIKHITEHPSDHIFFLGRFWNSKNRPFQSEEYMALRICYTKWYNKRDIPFSIKVLHLYRMLSICLPFYNGKEFLDKYLFDYPPYKDFLKTKSGFIYIKEFIQDNFKPISHDAAFDVDNY